MVHARRVRHHDRLDLFCRDIGKHSGHFPPGQNGLVAKETQFHMAIPTLLKITFRVKYKEPRGSCTSGSKLVLRIFGVFAAFHRRPS